MSSPSSWHILAALAHTALNIKTLVPVTLSGTTWHLLALARTPWHYLLDILCSRVPGRRAPGTQQPHGHRAGVDGGNSPGVEKIDMPGSTPGRRDMSALVCNNLQMS